MSCSNLGSRYIRLWPLGWTRMSQWSTVSKLLENIHWCPRWLLWGSLETCSKITKHATLTTLWGSCWLAFTTTLIWQIRCRTFWRIWLRPKMLTIQSSLAVAQISKPWAVLMRIGGKGSSSNASSKIGVLLIRSRARMLMSSSRWSSACWKAQPVPGCLSHVLTRRWWTLLLLRGARTPTVTDSNWSKTCWLPMEPWTGRMVSTSSLSSKKASRRSCTTARLGYVSSSFRRCASTGAHSVSSGTRVTSKPMWPTRKLWSSV